MGTARLLALLAFSCFAIYGLQVEAQVVSNISDSGSSSCGTGNCGTNNALGPLFSGDLLGGRLYSIGTGFNGGCGGSQLSRGLGKLGLNGNDGALRANLGSRVGGGSASCGDSCNGGFVGGGGLLGGGVGNGALVEKATGGRLRSQLGNGIGGRLSMSDQGSTYISLIAGVSFLNDQQSTGFNRQVDAVFNEGSTFGGAIGMRKGNMRYEIEYTHRNNTPETIDFNGNPISVATVGGKTISHSGMFNMAIDLNRGSKLTPYVGAGVGFTFIDSDLRYGSLPARLNGEDNSFAYQAFAGLSRKTAAGGDLFVEYRYFSAENPKLNRFGGPGINGAPQNIILDSHYDAHNLLFGMRIRF